MKLHQSKTGFSLVELLVVLAIIGLLAGLMLPALSAARESGRQAVCLSNLRQLYLANTTYAGDFGTYAPAAPEIAGANVKRWFGTRPNGGVPFDSTTGPLSRYLGSSRGIRSCPSMGNWKFLTDPAVAFEAGCGGYGYNEVGVGSQSYILTISPDEASLAGMTPEGIARPSTTVMFGDTAFPQLVGGQMVLFEYSFAEPDKFLDGTSAQATIHFRHRQHANLVWCDGHASAETMTRSSSSAFKKYSVGWFGTQTNNFYYAPF